MGSSSTSGSSDQRPAAVGGPLRVGSGRPAHGPLARGRPATRGVRRTGGPRARTGRALVRGAAAGQQRAQGREGVVGDPPRPDQVPQVGDQGLVVGAADGLGQGAEEVGAAAGERVEHGLLGRGGRPGRRGAGQGEVGGVGEVQRDPAVVAGQRPVAAPEHLAGADQLVEQGGGVVGDPRWAARGSRGRWPAATAPPSCSTARTSPSRPRRPPPTPCHGRQEPGQLDGGDRLDLGPQRGQRAAPQHAQHLGVAVVEAVRPAAVLGGQQLALDDAAGGDQPAQGVEGDGRAEPHHAATVGGGERPVGAGVAGDEVAERVGHRLEEGLRDPDRQRAARGRRAAGRRPRSRPTAPRPRPAPRMTRRAPSSSTSQRADLVAGHASSRHRATIVVEGQRPERRAAGRRRPRRRGRRARA